MGAFLLQMCPCGEQSKGCLRIPRKRLRPFERRSRPLIRSCSAVDRPPPSNYAALLSCPSPTKKGPNSHSPVVTTSVRKNQRESCGTCNDGLLTLVNEDDLPPPPSNPLSLVSSPRLMTAISSLLAKMISLLLVILMINGASVLNQSAGKKKWRMKCSRSVACASTEQTQPLPWRKTSF